MNRWRERLWGGIFGLLIAGAVGLAVVAGGPRSLPPPAADPEPTAPEAADPTAAEQIPECHLGVVLASDAVDVVAEIEGRLEEVQVRSGDAVEQGETLAVLDTEAARQQLAIERAMISAAEAEERRYALEVERAGQVLRRQQGLGDLISAAEVDAAEYQRDIARSALEGAVAGLGQVEARIARLESTLSRSRIRAPFAGIVAMRYHDPGTVVAPGMPIVRLISSGASLVRFAVSPEKAAAVAHGTPVRVEILSTGAALPGVVEHRAPEIDAPSEMVFVEAWLDAEAAAELTAPAGAVARVTVLAAGETPATCLSR